MEVHHPVCILALGSGQRLLYRLGLVLGLVLVRAYSKRAVQPICAVQDEICAVQNEKLCSPKTQS